MAIVMSDTKTKVARVVRLPVRFRGATHDSPLPAVAFPLVLATLAGAAVQGGLVAVIAAALALVGIACIAVSLARRRARSLPPSAEVVYLPLGRRRQRA